jgi:predicted double-glycine peptidase
MKRCIPYVLITLAMLLLFAKSGNAGPVNVYSHFGNYNYTPQSKKEMRWNTVIRQQYDFSCGSAAVATLLTFHYNKPTSEQQVFNSMYKNGNQNKIKSQGFSMLDMKKYLDSEGLRSDGFKMDLDKFVEIGVPGISLVNTRGYRHFVVVKGINNSHVLVGDPATGVVVVSREQFEKIWSGSVLAARAEITVAKEHFNHPDDWKVRPPSPLSAAVDRRALSPALLSLPGRYEINR